MSSAGQRERELVPLWRRCAAGLVDAAIGLAPGALLLATGVISLDRWHAPEGILPLDHAAATFYRTRGWLFWQWILVWTPFCLMHAIFGMFERSTPGAALFGLSVVGPDGHRASSVRGVFRGLAYVTWPATLLLAPLLVAVGPAQRGPHDLLSGTFVIRAPSRPARAVP